jgi:hypothetical protein
VKSDSEIAKLCKKQRNISKRGLSVQYDNTIACQSFYNGDMMTYQDRIQFEDDSGRRKRALVNFNKVQANVDAVVGFAAQNRRQAKYTAYPFNGQSQPQEIYSKNMNALYDYHREKTNSDQLETDQDADMFTLGYGAIETDLSYIVGNSTKDPNGSIVKMKLDPMKIGWDPAARGKNLLDAKWAYYYEDFELQDALELFQGSSADDFEQVSDTDSGDAGYVYNPWGGLYDKIKLLDSVEWISKEQDMVRVYNHQWMEYETFYRAPNPLYTVTDPLDAMFIKARLDVIQSDIEQYYPDGIESGDMFDFDPKAEELIFDDKTRKILIKEFGDMMKTTGFIRECYYTAVISGEHVFNCFKSICQQGFSIKFKTGVYNDTGKFWIGMINSMMEPQKYYNKALTELMFTIAANSKGGVMVEEDAVEDIADFSNKWAKTDAVIKVASGAISGQKIQQKAQGAVPTGLENIITLSDSAIAAAGVDPSMLGQTDSDDQSGILFKRRIRQVISKMARYFDSISLYQKEDARLCADLIRVWVQNNNGQWVKITGELNKDIFIQVSDDMFAPQYDVSIQESPLTPEDRQQTASILGTYGDKLIQFNPTAAQAFYAESLGMLPLDSDVRNRLSQTLQPQQPPIDPAMVQQMQARIQELEGQQNQADIAKKLADAKYSEARAQQTLVNNQLIQSKVPLTHAQTVSTLETAKKTSAETEQALKAPATQVHVNA